MTISIGTIKGRTLLVVPEIGAAELAVLTVGKGAGCPADATGNVIGD